MACTVCSKASSPYRCPQCDARYCSVVCYKQHKVECKPATEETTDVAGDKVTIEPTSGTISTSSADTNPKFESVFQDEQIRELLQYPGVKKHLQLVARIVRDASVSGEPADEGRRLVAVKKLRELRKGGRESNEAVEQFCGRVAQLLQ